MEVFFMKKTMEKTNGNEKATGRNKIIRRRSKIIRIEKTPGTFVTMNKGFLEDDRLSYKEKGLLGYILSKPDDWKIIVKDLTNNATDGRDSVYSGLKELEKYGYYKKEPVRDEKGRVSHWESIIYECPNGEPPHEPSKKSKSKNDMESSSLPTDSPVTDLPYMAEPETEKPEHTNNQITKNKENIELGGIKSIESASLEKKYNKNKASETASPDLIDLINNADNPVKLYTEDEVADKIALDELKSLCADSHMELDLMHRLISNVLAKEKLPVKLRAGQQNIDSFKVRNAFSLLTKNHVLSIIANINRNGVKSTIRDPEPYFMTSLFRSGLNPKPCIPASFASVLDTPKPPNNSNSRPKDVVPKGFNPTDFYNKIERESRKLLEMSLE